MKALVFIIIFTAFRNGYCDNSDSIPYSEITDKEGSVIEKRAAGDPFSRRSAVDKNFIRFGRSSNYFHEQPNRAQKNHMSLARVSRATKENFMRFGRPDIDATEDGVMGVDKDDNFIRFGRGKDNFMRFGRGKDNFMRFGKAKDNFMRFGRKENFMRFGRNFMRFGRGKDNFMRFGRGKDNFMRFGRKFSNIDAVKNILNKEGDNDSKYTIEIPVNRKNDNKGSFVRFGKSPKKEDGFIRFGRGDVDTEQDYPKIDDDGPELVLGDLDLQADKPKNGPINRSKREVDATTLWEVEGNSITRASRDAELVEDVPPQSTIPKAPNVKRSPSFDLFMIPNHSSESSNDDDDSEPENYYFVPDGEEEKRSNGGSSFIRFG